MGAAMGFEPMDETLIPSALSRYQQIIFPVLKLCQAIMASLGSENRSAATQVLHFITAHECIVRVGLHFSNLFTLAGLQELSLLTGVISRSVTFETSTFEFDTPELASHLSRIQRQMVSLMAHFGHQDCLVKKIAQGNLFAEDCKAKALNYVMEINSNCLAYSAAIMGKAKQCRVIMVPNLSEAIPDYSSNDPGVHGGRSMSLGHLVILIQHVMAHLMTTRTSLRDLKDKLSSVNQLSSNEVAAFLSDSRLSRGAPSDQRSLVADEISKGITDKEHQLELCVDSLENASYVLWRHLDHFVNTPSPRQRIELDPVVKSRRSDQGWYGSEEAIEKLKKDTRSCFNDTLFRKLDGIESTFEEDKRGSFFATINRRLKRIATLYT